MRSVSNMTKPPHSAPSTKHAPEPESMDDLRQDCARMSARWTSTESAQAKDAEPATASLLHGVRVPDRSARLLDGMSDYGD